MKRSALAAAWHFAKDVRSEAREGVCGEAADSLWALKLVARRARGVKRMVASAERVYVRHCGRRR